MVYNLGIWFQRQLTATSVFGLGQPVEAEDSRVDVEHPVLPWNIFAFQHIFNQLPLSVISSQNSPISLSKLFRESHTTSSFLFVLDIKQTGQISKRPFITRMKTYLGTVALLCLFAPYIDNLKALVTRDVVHGLQFAIIDIGRYEFANRMRHTIYSTKRCQRYSKANQKHLH